MLALPSDIRGRLHTPVLRRQEDVHATRTRYRAEATQKRTLAEGGFRWNRRYGQTDPMPAVTDYTIIEWAVRFRSRNWAVRTGTIPGLDGRCLVVVDVDYPELLNVTEHDLFFMSPLPHPYGRPSGASTSTPTPRPRPRPTPKPKWGEVKAEGQFVMLHLQYSWKRALPYLQDALAGLVSRHLVAL